MEGLDGRIVDLIGAAVMVGAYGALAREIPEASPGLTKMRDKHRERVKTLSDQICADAGLEAQAPRAMPPG